MSANALLPCPCCGDLAWMHADGGTLPDARIGYRVECEGACHLMTCYWHTEDEARAAWNSRLACEQVNLCKHGFNANCAQCERDAARGRASQDTVAERDDAAHQLASMGVLRAFPDNWRALAHQAAADYAALREQLAAATRDGERYRFLRNGSPEVAFYVADSSKHWQPVGGDDLDLAIDAATSAAKGERG